MKKSVLRARKPAIVCSSWNIRENQCVIDKKWHANFFVILKLTSKTPCGCCSASENRIPSNLCSRSALSIFLFCACFFRFLFKKFQLLLLTVNFLLSDKTRFFTTCNNLKFWPLQLLASKICYQLWNSLTKKILSFSVFSSRWAFKIIFLFQSISARAQLQTHFKNNQWIRKFSNPSETSNYTWKVD